MSESETRPPTEGEQQPSPAAAQPAKGKTDPIGEFKSLPSSDKLLAATALAVLVGFIFTPTYSSWKALFDFDRGWFPTLAFVGSIAVIALLALELFKVWKLEGSTRSWALLLLSLLPAAGFVIDMLSRNFWMAFTLAGAIGMAYAASQSSLAQKLLD